MKKTQNMEPGAQFTWYVLSDCSDMRGQFLPLCITYINQGDG